MMKSEIENRAGFSFIRYAQCWEDTDLVLEAMNIKEGDKCLSIGSAGDNSLAILAFNPGKVVALDLSPSQIALLELKVAAFKVLEHQEMLVLLGYRKGPNRLELFDKVEDHLTKDAKEFWQVHAADIESGIAASGKFEKYFATFRNVVMPLIHSSKTVDELLQPKNFEERVQFFNSQWNTWRWRALFRIFFSKTVMGLLGRDPSFFNYARGNLPAILLASTKQALVNQDPSQNPYLHWILKGEFGNTLPFFLRKENFKAIKKNIDKLEWHQQSLEDYLSINDVNDFDSFNLSDVFEYMSQESYENLLHMLVSAGRPNARLVYWNMMVPRQCVDANLDSLMPLESLSRSLFINNKTFFYCNFLVEEIRKPSKVSETKKTRKLSKPASEATSAGRAA